MPQEGYADPIANDGPGFHSITPVSELTELVFEPERSGQATKLSPSCCEEPDGVAQNNSQPARRPDRARGLKCHGTATPNSRRQHRRHPATALGTATPKLALTGSATSGYGS
jgi:hypothetical protein